MVGVILMENLIWKRKALALITSQNDNFNFVFGQFASLGCSVNPFFEAREKRLLHFTSIGFSVQ